MRYSRVKLPKVEATSESDYLNRRELIKQMGITGIGMSAAMIGVAGMPNEAQAQLSLPPVDKDPALKPGLKRKEVLDLFPAKRNEKFNFDDKLTDQRIAARYNNFYEFTTRKTAVWPMAQDKFTVDPWTIEVTGECAKPQKFDIDDIMKIEQEERTYHFRCVEAWAMDVPWTGFSLSKLLAKVEPKDSAKFVRLFTIKRPSEMPGIESQHWYPWPYFEGLRMDEAMNELTMLASGIYGRPMPAQHGAPFRIVVPWKYGYKSPKSIAKIELVSEQPTSFWEKLQPKEYPFESNVEPTVPHPRWSQASERMIGTGVRRPTKLYNGYEEYVGHLYKKG